MTTRNVSFLNDLKKGDEVYLVSADYKGRKSGKPAFVVSRGPKWLTISISQNAHKERFDIRTGCGEVDSGYRRELWENEAAWQADVHKNKVWSDFRSAVNAQFNPPERLSVENIEKMAEIFGRKE